MNSHLFVVGILGLGPAELILILAILLVLFGGAKLPSLAKNLGSSIKEFKKAAKEGAEEDDSKPEEAKKEKTDGAKPANANGKN